MGRIHVEARAQDRPTCGLCRAGIHDAPATCEECRATYHPPCLEELGQGRCATAGCRRLVATVGRPPAWLASSPFDALDLLAGDDPLSVMGPPLSLACFVLVLFTELHQRGDPATLESLCYWVPRMEPLELLLLAALLLLGVVPLFARARRAVRRLLGRG